MSDRLRHIIEVHFDPRWGAPYWLECMKQWRFDPRREITSQAELSRIPGASRESLTKRPIEDFIPKRFQDCLSGFITCETGGATGPPCRTAFRSDEFEEAFVTPFIKAAAYCRFPSGRNWLFIGPTGPHPIGKAARACAIATGSMDPFMVDFDPRWFRRLAHGSIARQRYLEHILAQAKTILYSQDIGVLFSTPPILAALGNELDLSIRERITGVHLGGMAAEATFWRNLIEQWFPNAVAMAGYGNSLAGMCPQLLYNPSRPPEYFPYGGRLLFEVRSSHPDLPGQVFFHRLDESVFLPNMAERDVASLIIPSASFKAMGFDGAGLRDPRPPEGSPEQNQEGLY